MGTIRWGVLALVAASATWAATLPYQGLATDAKGNPKADRSYAVDFALYQAASGGAPLWSESRFVTTAKGLFSTSLGQVTEIPDSLFKGPALYLGVIFDGGIEAGRVRLGTTPWAKKADSANFAQVAGSAISVPGLLDSLAKLSAANARLAAKVRGDSSTAAKVLLDSARSLRDSIARLQITVNSLVSYLAPVAASPWKTNFANGVLLDARDARIYRTVVMGRQTWMAENLNYAGRSNSIGACDNNIQANCDKFGRQYTFAQVLALDDSCNTVACASLIATKHQGVCPASWHVPGAAEWDTLARFVDPAAHFSTSIGAVSIIAGPALKSTADWTTTNGTDSYGFRALPAGGYTPGTGGIGVAAAWWAAKEVNAGNGLRWEIRSVNDLSRSYVPKIASVVPALIPVRCIKD